MTINYFRLTILNNAIKLPLLKLLENYSVRNNSIDTLDCLLPHRGAKLTKLLKQLTISTRTQCFRNIHIFSFIKEWQKQVIVEQLEITRFLWWTFLWGFNRKINIKKQDLDIFWPKAEKKTYYSLYWRCQETKF